MNVDTNGHSFIEAEPFSERMRCSVCGYRITHARIASLNYGEKIPPCDGTIWTTQAEDDAWGPIF